MMERTHLLRNDLDWLPGWLKAVRWTVAGTVWTGIFGGLAATVWAAHGQFIYFGKGMAAVVFGGYYAGDKAARAILRARLSKLAHGDVDLAKLKHESDGELVHVRGRVRALQRLEEGVYHREVFRVGEARVVHERAVDFALVDDSGERVLVQVADARLIAADPSLKPVADERAFQLLDLPLPSGAQRFARNWRQRKQKGKRALPIRAGDVWLRDGEEVDVVGYKTRAVDPTVERMEREMPLRATLRGGKELPLLIATAGDAPPTRSTPSRTSTG